jgi:DNA polymerase III alpha subunit
MPGLVFTEQYIANLSSKAKGKYRFAIRLYDRKSDMPVEIGLIEEMKMDGYFIIQSLTF